MNKGIASRPESTPPVSGAIAHEPAPRRAPLLRAILIGLILALLAPILVPTATRIAAGLRYPYQMDSEEGFVLWQAWQLRQGRNIFRPLDEPPYVAATYGPAYPLLGAATLWGAKPSFFGGRLIAALSVAAICALMALITWQLTRQALAAALGPFLFLNTFDVYQWLPFYRVDFTALAIGLAGLWLLVRDGRRRPWRFRAACACFVAMVYTKQVEVAPFVATFVYLLAIDRARAWRLLRNVALWGLAIAAVLTLATRGQFLVHNVYYNANPFSTWQLGRMLGHVYRLQRFFLLALAVCLITCAVALWRSRRATDHADAGPGAPNEAPSAGTGLFAIYAIVASIGLLGLGKIGAATNYIIEPKAAWSLFLALVVGAWLRRTASTPRRLARPIAFYAVAILLVLHSFEFLLSSTLHVTQWARFLAHEGAAARFVRREPVLRYLAARPPTLAAPANRNPTIVDRVNGDRIVDLMRARPGPIFSEHAILPMLAGHEVYIQPFIMSQLAREGKWDQAPVVRALREARFPLIASTEDVTSDDFLFHYTKEMAEAIREAYRRSAVAGDTSGRPSTFRHYLFEPKEEFL